MGTKGDCLVAVAEAMGAQNIAGVTPDIIMKRIEDISTAFDGKEEAVVVETVNAVMKSFFSEAGARRMTIISDLQAIGSALAYIKENYADNPRAGLTAIMVGNQIGDFDSRGRSTALNQHTMATAFQGDLIRQLRLAKVWDEFLDKEYTKDVFKAARALDDKDDEALKGLKPKAVTIAKVLSSESEKRRNKMMSVGIILDPLSGRVTRQHHDVWKLRRASSYLDKGQRRFGIFPKRGESATDRAAWVEYVWENLDKDRTFGRDRVLKDGETLTEGAERSDMSFEKQQLGVMYDEFMNGFQQAYTGFNPLKTSRGTYNPSHSLEADKKLHFTPEGEVNYMELFGHGNIRDTVLSELQHSAFRIGLVESLGSNPLDNLQALVGALARDIDGDSPAGRDLKNYVGGFANGDFGSQFGRQYLEISGANNRVVSDIGALVGSSLRTFEFVTKLGMSAVSSIADVANVATEIYKQRRGDEGFFSSFAEALKVPMKGMSKGELREFAESAGIGVDGMLGSFFDRFGTMDGASGFMAKTMSVYFKYNGLNAWTDASRRGLYIANTNYMAKVLRMDDIPKQYRRLLGAYGITDQDLIHMQHKDMFFEQDGKEYFDVNAIDRIPLEDFARADIQDSVGIIRHMNDVAKIHPSDIPDEKLLVSFLREEGLLPPDFETNKKYRVNELDMESDLITSFFEFEELPKQSQDRIKGMMKRDIINESKEKILISRRDKLKNRLRMFFTDRNDYGVLTPGAEFDAKVHYGQGRGDPMRELMQFFAQFKMYPLALGGQVFKNTLLGQGAGSYRGALKNTNGELNMLAAHVVMLTGFGSVALTLKDIAKNRVPVVPTTPEEYANYFKASMLSGGALGLYGDFILGEVDSEKSLFRFFGPVANDALKLGSIFRDGARVAFSDDELSTQEGSKMWNSMKDFVPAANIFYTKSAFDFMAFHWIGETWNPGYLQLQEEALKTRNKHGSIIDPNIIPRGGVRRFLGA